MDNSSGPFKVGMMALKDKPFFERLIADPRAALADKTLRGKLQLTDADVDTVVQLIQTSGPPLSPADGRTLWDRWHEREVPIWPKRCWPSY